MKRKIVVKMGGSILDAEDVLVQFAEAVAIIPGNCDVVVVHGGGKDIGRQLERMGREFTFIDGLRVTDDDVIDVVEMVLSGLSTSEQTFSELTSIAECIVTTVFQRAFREITKTTPLHRQHYAFSILAVGKLGSEMMDFGSDLDLIFIYTSMQENRNTSEIHEYSIELAQHILLLITGGGGVYKLYDVDARLRPEGGEFTPRYHT